MFSDTFLAPLPRGQQLHEIETVANYIATKILSANKSYLTSNDVSEKIDILLCLITYQSTLSLLNAAYITEDDNTLELAKQTYRNVPNHLTHTTNFTADDLEAFVDMMTEALQASSSIEVILLSHLTDNKSFIGLAESIRGKTNVYKRA